MAYRERETVVAGAVLWQRRVGSAPSSARILPDGCMDLIWDGRRLLVAGPDVRARWHSSSPGCSYVGLRFAGGRGPALLGVRADEMRDLSLDLEELWPAKEIRVLAGQVAADPVAGLERWLIGRAGGRAVDRLGPTVFALAAAGMSVADMADRLGLGSRQLHRRCLPLFGYGPRHLGRVLRLGRALAQGGSESSLAQVAVMAGFADQAHLSREIRDLTGTTPTRLLRELAA